VIFVPDNVTPTAYEPGEFYEVPAHVARGMIQRGVAVLARPVAEPTERVDDMSIGAATMPEKPSARRARQ
jgi:hypothetical protein